LKVKFPAAADSNGLFKKLFNFRRRQGQTAYLKFNLISGGGGFDRIIIKFNLISGGGGF